MLFSKISLCIALWLPEVHLRGAPFGNLGKPFTALLVSLELTRLQQKVPQKKRGAREENKREGVEEKVGGGIILHSSHRRKISVRAC